MKNYLFYNGNKEKIKQEICNIIPEPDRTDILNEGLSLENILEECGGPEDFFYR